MIDACANFVSRSNNTDYRHAKERKCNPRIEWIDIAKGFSIILVVYGHAGLASLPFQIGDWFGSFRMPFFFIVSGLLFAPNKYPTLKSFISRRWPTLIRPFFIFSAIVLVGYWCLDPHNIGNKISDVVLSGWGGYALWFIPVLIVSQILFYIIQQLSTSKVGIPIGLLICGLVGYITSFYNIKVPHNLCFSLTASALYGGGYLLSPWLKNRLTHSDNLSIVIFTFVMLLLSFTFLLNSIKPEFYLNQLSSWPTYTAALGGAMMMCGVAILFSRMTNKYSNLVKNLIIFFGKNSYIVLAFHQIILLLLGKSGYMPNGVVERGVMWIILYGIIWLVNSYFPFVVGKKKVIATNDTCCKRPSKN